MTKLKTPMLGLGASGSLADALTFQERPGTSYVRKKPYPVQPNSLAQMYQRWLYQDYVSWWHTLAASVKEQWEKDARPYHMTGFAYWMKYCLANLPDILVSLHLDVLIDGKTPDSGKKGLDGTVYGAVPAPGLIDHAFYFDGSNDYISLGNSFILCPQDHWTVEFFVYLYQAPGSFPDSDNILFQRGSGTGAGRCYVCGISNVTKALYYIIDLGAGQSYDVSAWQAGSWHHIAISYDLGTLALFLEGAFIQSVGAQPNIPLYDWPTLLNRFGRLQCRFDQVIFRNRTLTPQDIKRHSERRFPLQ